MTAIPLLIALTQVAGALSLDAQTMIDASQDDPHGGYHVDYFDGFPIGSMWRVEGQFLYALVRALKPQRVLELGTSHGCSATHILQGLTDNEMGVLECVDNGSQVGVVGDMIPDHLRARVIIHQTSVEEWVTYAANQRTCYDLIFEDAMHNTEQVALVWNAARELLNPSGVIVSHDAMHSVAGFAVREGIAMAGYKTTNILIKPADCGFALWRRGMK